MKIRIKNKHLISFILLVAVSFGAVSLFGGDYLFYRAQKAEQAGDNVKALAYYDALIQRYPGHSRVPDALYWSAELLPSFDSFIATFYPQRSSMTRRDGGIPELAEGSLTRIERYLRIQEEFPRHWAAAHVPYRLADAYHSLGDPSSEELYLKVLENERATGRLDAALRLVQIYEGQGRFDEALAVLEYCQIHLPDHSPIEVKMKLGDVLGLKGDRQGAREAYAEVLVMAEEQERELRSRRQGETQFGVPVEISVLPHYQSQIEDKLVSLDMYEAGESAFVEGRVTLRGQPLAGIHVYANPIFNNQRSYYGRSEPGLWVTGQDGSFTGILPAGTYEFGIGLNYHQAKLVEGAHLQIIHGELDLTETKELPLVEFRFVEPVKLTAPQAGFVYRGEPFTVTWEPYPGAHEYSVSVSGVTIDSQGGTSYVSAPDLGKIEQTSMVYERRTVNQFGVVGYDSVGVHPAYLVGRPEGYDRLKISVRALDEKGNTLASNGGLHFGGESPAPGEIAVQEGLRNRAEELLFDRKYDKAVTLLEKRIAEDPADVDTLWTLARIYFSGTHAKGEDPWDIKSFNHLDPEKSLALLERIQRIESTPEVEEAIETVRNNLVKFRP